MILFVRDVVFENQIDFFKDYKKFNMSNDYIVFGPNKNITTLKYIIPKFFTSYEDLVNNFDIEKTYAEYLSFNKEAFQELILILTHAYMGKDVCVIVSEFVKELNDAVMKIMQMKYSYIVQSINYIEDLEYIKNIDFMTQEGLLEFDRDRELVISNVKDKKDGILEELLSIES